MPILLMAAFYLISGIHRPADLTDTIDMVGPYLVRYRPPQASRWMTGGLPYAYHTPAYRLRMLFLERLAPFFVRGGSFASIWVVFSSLPINARTRTRLPYTHPPAQHRPQRDW